MRLMLYFVESVAVAAAPDFVVVLLVLGTHFSSWSLAKLL